MAAAEVAALLEKIRPNPLECCVCLQPLTAGTTAMLPCCHGFHRACLVKQVEAHSGTPLRCGVCGTEAPDVKTADAVAKLPKHLLVEAQVAEPVHCKLCKEEAGETADAVAYCTTCSTPLCDGHRGFHQTRKVFAGHAVEPLGTAAAAPSCPVHAGKPVDVYCVACGVACCALCMLTAHKTRNHETVVLADHVSQLRRGVKRVHALATERSKAIVKRLAGVQSAMTDMDARAGTLEHEVRRAIRVLMQTLALREETLLQELRALTAQERAALEAEQGEDQRRWLALEGALRTAELLAKAKSSPDPVVGQLATPVETHLRAATHDALSAPPPAALIDFVVPDDMVRTLSTVGSFVHRHAYGPECVAEGRGTVRSVLSTGGTFTVTARTPAKKRVTTGGDRVTAHLVFVRNGSTTEAKVEDRGDGTYAVFYMVRVDGKYQLHVAVNARPVRGSPFSVTVVKARTFTFAGHPFQDKSGLIYYLATEGGTHPWTNPLQARILTVTVSSFSGKGHRPHAFVDNNNAEGYCYALGSANEPTPWMSVTLHKKQLLVTGYALSSVTPWRHLRNWCFQGSNDRFSWMTLRTHTNDHTLTEKNCVGYWAVDDANGAFSTFRIFQTGADSSGQLDSFAVGSLELYGELLEP